MFGSNHRHGGFSLIELMIAVAIVGILAAITIPSYQQHVRESHRTEAQQALMNAQLLLEEYRIGCNAYGEKPVSNSSLCTAVSVADDLELVDTSHYRYELRRYKNYYLLYAYAQGNQAEDREGDTSCQQMVINHSDQFTPEACW